MGTVSNRVRIETYQEKGTADICEDALVVNNNKSIYGVVDGASSVVPFRNEKGQTGGYIVANMVKEYMNNEESDCSLYELINRVNKKVKNAMLEEGIDIQEKRDLWCAAFVLFKIHEENIEFIQAGDCMLFAKYTDGTIRALTRDQLLPFDTYTIKKREEAIKQGYHTTDEIFEYVLPYIKDARINTNTSNGYAVLNGEEELSHYVERGVINKAHIEKIYAITDGLFYPSEETDRSCDFDEMIRIIDAEGLENYAKKVIHLEQQDPDLIKFPRHKLSDDKTGIVIHFQ